MSSSGSFSDMHPTHPVVYSDIGRLFGFPLHHSAVTINSPGVYSDMDFNTRVRVNAPDVEFVRCKFINTKEVPPMEPYRHRPLPHSLFGVPLYQSAGVPRDRAVVVGDYQDLVKKWVDAINLLSTPPAKPKPSANELAFRELGVETGDFVRLVPRGHAGAQLEGRVEQIKTVNAGLESQLRIKGFDETPHGNHNVYFGVENHTVEILEKVVHPLTLDEKILLAVANRSEEYYRGLPDTQRDTLIRLYRGRIDAVKALLPAG